MKSQSPLRILFADDDAESRSYFRELLPQLGHQVFTVSSSRELRSLAEQVEPDLIITDIVMPDMDGIEAVMAVSARKPTPVILISAHHDAELLSRVGTDHIMNYLIKPVSRAEVQVAIAVAMQRFRQFQALAEEASNLRQALEDRKLLERAKGAVMKRLRVDEDEAFRRMKKLASNHNRKLVEVAQEIINAELIYRNLERV